MRRTCGACLRLLSFLGGSSGGCSSAGGSVWKLENADGSTHTHKHTHSYMQFSFRRLYNTVLVWDGHLSWRCVRSAAAGRVVAVCVSRWTSWTTATGRWWTELYCDPPLLSHSPLNSCGASAAHKHTHSNILQTYWTEISVFSLFMKLFSSWGPRHIYIYRSFIYFMYIFHVLSIFIYSNILY